MLTSLITLPVRVGIRTAEFAVRTSQAAIERAIGLVGEVIMPTADRTTERPERTSARPPERTSARPDERTSARPPERTSARPDERTSARPEDESQREPERQGPSDPRSQAPPPAEVVAQQEAVAPEPELAAEAEREPEPAAQAEPEAEPGPAGVLPGQEEPAHVSEEASLVEEVAEPGAEDGAGAQVHIDEPWDGYSSLSAPDIVDRIKGSDTAELGAVELYELAHRKRQTVLDAVKRELRRAQNSA